MAQTVLVVEDEAKIRDLLRSYLERAGLDVLTTSSGAEAIAMVARAAPDLMILDLTGRFAAPMLCRSWCSPQNHRTTGRCAGALTGAAPAWSTARHSADGRPWCS